MYFCVLYGFNHSNCIRRRLWRSRSRKKNWQPRLACLELLEAPFQIWMSLLENWLFNNEIDAMAFHRGFMHSFLFAILAAVGFGMLVFWIYNRGKRYGMTTRNQWMWLFFASIFTHPILDSFTAYGTQLFAPFSDYRVAFNNIAVADPLYTLPFLIALIIMMCFNRTSTKRSLFLKIGLGISSLYMLFTFVNKYHVHGVYKQSLEDQQMNYVRFQTQPTIS